MEVLVSYKFNTKKKKREEKPINKSLRLYNGLQ